MDSSLFIKEMPSKLIPSICLLIIIGLVHKSSCSVIAEEKKEPTVAVQETLTTQKESEDNHEHVKRQADFSAEEKQKHRSARRRHIRRDAMTPFQDEIEEIFNVPAEQKQSRPNRHTRRNANFFLPYFGQQFSAYPSLPNSYIPSPHSVNQFYNPYNSLPAGVSQLQYPQQSSWNPFAFGGIQVIYVPVPVCFTPPQSSPPSKPAEPDTPAETDTNDVAPNRFGGNDDNIPEIPKYPDTQSGFFTDVVGPLRPPTIQAPPVNHGSSNAQNPDNINQVQSSYPVQQGQRPSRPAQGRPLTPRPRPFQPTTTTRAPPSFNRVEPFTCSYAIVVCCTRSTNRSAQEDCFEQMDCSGAFFSENACETPAARAIIQYVNNNGRNAN